MKSLPGRQVPLMVSGYQPWESWGKKYTLESTSNIIWFKISKHLGTNILFVSSKCEDYYVPFGSSLKSLRSDIFILNFLDYLSVCHLIPGLSVRLQIGLPLHMSICNVVPLSSLFCWHRPTYIKLHYSGLFNYSACRD